MKQLIFLMVVMGLLQLSACSNTIEGMGKDMEQMGKSIQDSVDKTKQEN